MGAIHPNPDPALLFFSLLAVDQAGLEQARLVLEEQWGASLLRSEAIKFDFSEYYTPEMGPALLRQWALSGRLIGQDEIIDIKRTTNEMEERFRRPEDGGRSVNIDPGYLNLGKVVLATTKDYCHRLYLGRGIYGEVTLVYRAKTKGFEPWPWTYPDHCEGVALRFFGEGRERYKALMRERQEQGPQCRQK